MSWLSSLLHPERGYKKAGNTLDRYYTEGQGYIRPYQQHGLDEFPTLQEQLNKLMNPAGLQDEWMKNYIESEQAKRTKTLAQNQGLDAASSMGLLGSTPALGAIQEGTTNIGLQDRQNYLDALMQKYLQGINGAMGIYNTGANAGNQLANNALNTGNNQAQLKYGQTNAQGSMLGNLIGGGLSLGLPPILNNLMPNSTRPWSYTGGR